MTIRDRFWVSFRHIRSRMVESTLVIVATTVGVALVAAMVAFIQAYNNQTDYLLSHPAYRELLVEVIGNETGLTEPATPYDPSTTREIRLGAENLEEVLQDAPLVTYGYLADAETLSTVLPGAVFDRGGAMAAMASAFPGGEGGVTLPERFEPPDGAPGIADGQTADDRGTAGRRQFDLEQFFQTDPDVVTELPVESFPGRSITADFFDAYGIAAEEGSLFTNEDVEEGNQVIVLGSTLAETLFPDGDALGTKVRLNMQTYTVIGILKPSELSDVETNTPYDRVAFIPNGEGRVSFGGTRVRFQRPTRTLRFAVGDSANLDSAADQLQAFFDAEFGEGTIRITAPIAALKAEREKLGRILAVVLFLATAGLFIASINVFNLMLMRVIRRTKSVGISRALGATRRGIGMQFFNESALMTIIATGIGFGLSPLVYRMLGKSLVQEAATGGVNWMYLLIGAIAAMAFSLLFGVYPARQAGRIDAAVAIRSE